MGKRGTYTRDAQYSRARFKSRFPRSKFADENTMLQQFGHMQTELLEVRDELNALLDAAAGAQTSKLILERLAMEALDLIHSTETFLYILAEQHGVQVNHLVEKIIVKNELRGYYPPNRLK